MEERITISIKKELKLQLEYMAKIQKVSLSEIVRNILESAISSKENDDKSSAVMELLLYLKPIIEHIDSFTVRNSIFLNEYSGLHLDPEAHKKLRSDVAVERNKYNILKGYVKE